MKGKITGFIRGFGTVAALGLLGLVLGFTAVLPDNTSASDGVVGSFGAMPQNIQQGQSTELRWNSFNATYVSINPGIGPVGPSGSKTVSPSSTTTYTMTMSNSDNTDTATLSTTVYVTPTQTQQPSVDISASPSSICPGGSSTLSWTSSNASSASINQGIGSVSLNSSRTVSPSSTTTYTITATGSNGATAQDSVTVNVSGSGSCGGGTPPTVDLRADDTRIDEGDETELHWTSTNADYCVRTGGRNGWANDRVGTSGRFDTGDLTRDTTYNIRCYNNFGSANDSETIRVEEDDDRVVDRTCRDRNALNYNGSLPCRYPTPNTNRPTVIVYADSTSLAYGGSTFVRWSTVNATSCEASGGTAGWTGPKSIGPGSFFTGSMTASRTFNLTCWNSAGSDTDSVTISVRPRTVTTTTTRRVTPPASSLVVITSTIDRNQPIQPTLDNTRPQPGDEITYTVTYQNIGNAAISNLVLRLDLPYEVNYLYSTPSNPIMSGNTLIFNLGSLAANGSGTVTVRVRVREDAAPGALLNFPAVLSYTDPAGNPQSVSANVSAQVWTNPNNMIGDEFEREVPLGAAAFLAGGFWPTSLLGWLLLIGLVLLLILLVKHILAGGFAGAAAANNGYARRTTTTTVEH